MCGLASRFQRQPDRTAVGDRHRAATVSRGGLADDAGVESELDRLPDAREPGVAAGLLVADEREPEVNRRLRVRLSERERDVDHPGDGPFHIARASAVEPVPVALAERVVRPLGRVERDRVEMTDETQRSVRRPRHRRDEVGFLRIDRNSLDLDAAVRQPRRDPRGGRRGVSGRVGGVVTDQRLGGRNERCAVRVKGRLDTAGEP